MKLTRVVLAVGVVTLWHAASQAASVTENGSLVNLSPPQAAEDVVDLDGEGVGTDGFVLFNSVPPGTNLSNRPFDENIINSAPAYVGTLTGNAAATSSGGWANYDDITVGGLTFNSGAGVINVGDGVESELLNFEIQGTPPQSFNLGVIMDNQDGPVWSPAGIRVATGSSSTAVVATPFDLGTDVYFFRIDNAVPGDTVQVFLTEQVGNGNPGALIGGLTFDTVQIPEPASAVLGSLALCGLMLGVRRRRRNR